jgi:hypothetical protein
MRNLLLGCREMYSVYYENYMKHTNTLWCSIYIYIYVCVCVVDIHNVKYILKFLRCLRRIILNYKMVLKPIWTYGLVIWGCTAPSNLAIIQRYKAKTLRQMTNAPRHVTNHIVHTDLCIQPVNTVFQATLKSLPNPLMTTILAPPHRKRLSRWKIDKNP